MIKLLGKNIGSMILDFGLSNIFLDMSPQAREIKEKKVVLHQTKKLLHREGNNQQNKKTIYRMRHGICKSYI